MTSNNNDLPRLLEQGTGLEVQTLTRLRIGSPTTGYLDLTLADVAQILLALMDQDALWVCLPDGYGPLSQQELDLETAGPGRLVLRCLRPLPGLHTDGRVV